MEGIAISKSDYKYPINLQDFNMVMSESGLQTHTAIIVGAETELVCGSETL